MIDWRQNTAYFSAMRWIIMLVIALFFWGCPGGDSVQEEGLAIDETQFIYLQDMNQLAFSMEVASHFGGTPLSSVWIEWRGTNPSGSPDSIALYDDGSHGDIIQDDNLWMRKIMNISSSELSLPVSASDSGKVYVSFNALFGTVTESKVDSFHLGNLKPHILTVVGPDTITRPTGSGYNLYSITCTVSDANGLDDIKWVGFRSYHTQLDSFMNGGNYIYMYDDGGSVILYEPNITSGDATANDGEFSFQVPLGSSANTGVYDWIFEAQDFQFEYSDTVVHRIVVE